MHEEINPFDILSGKIVQNNIGTFYFKEAGSNVYENGRPIVGRLHRENGPAAIWENDYHIYTWHKDGLIHRIGGPAIISRDGSKMWYVNSNRHRTDGPAIIYTNGNKEYWLNGKEYTEEKWQIHKKTANSML